MPFTETNRFWVIFDTCTRPEYYLDVHKLLALPRMATLRYDYKEKYVSPSAITASLSPETAPKFGLLLYGQRSGFKRGDGTPAAHIASNEMLWIPTRTVEMLCIPSRDSDTFYYDFKLLSYPRIDHDALARILRPLILLKETPFNKWVTTSSDLAAFNFLQKGEDRRNWGSIVNEFHKPEFQFSADVFWRIIGPTKGSGGKLVGPRYESTVQSGNVRQIKSIYDLEEGQKHSFEIVSISPIRQETTDLTQYSIKCYSTNDKNLDVIGAGIVDLRQSTANSVEFIGKVAEEIADHNATLRFETDPKPEDWPGGPELEIPVSIVKNKKKLVLGLITGLIGLLLIAYGGDVLKSSTFTGIAFLGIGFCLTFISGLLAFRRFILKG